MALVIDRIELADLGNPIELAKAILKQLPDIKPPIPIIEIAHALDIIEIKAITLDGFEGGLIAPDDKSNGCILINEKNSPQRQRFTIGHELGHYLNPWHMPTDGKFMCKSEGMVASTFEKNNLQQKMEVEANQFSAELLIPRIFFQSDTRRLRGPEIDHIVSLADKYEVSKETMGRRYVDFQDDACAVVFSKNGKVIYPYKSRFFPSLNVWNGNVIPRLSITAAFEGTIGTSSDWVELPSDVWLSRQDCYESIYEQVLVQQNGYRITLLTLGDEKNQDEREEDESWEVKFRR